MPDGARVAALPARDGEIQPEQASHHLVVIRDRVQRPAVSRRHSAIERPMGAAEGGKAAVVEQVVHLREPGAELIAGVPALRLEIPRRGADRSAVVL